MKQKKNSTKNKEKIMKVPEILIFKIYIFFPKSTSYIMVFFFINAHVNLKQGYLSTMGEFFIYSAYVFTSFFLRL